ncbi:efflux RND transporter permease subunit [Novosphingobium clariflavum]|uniref:Efflux RND transporter permease subunit n=1 Tax=Novosphingobium clariflavum TaxID=2029884 RepID=A0ABV6SBG0_9SPHN|nr:efflux RND transporter permease subunit [Novosphingobium clariflavum]
MLLALLLSSASADVDALFEAAVRSDTPGCALDVRRDGKLIVQRSYGMADLEAGRPIDADTMFEAGSVSKQFTGALIARLAGRYTLSYDDSIRRWLPELPAVYQPVTIAMLLHHTSGIRDWGALADLTGWPRGTREWSMDDAMALFVRQTKLNFAPGTEYLYSNSNYLLAARIAERAGGRSFSELAQAELFGPLGMTHTRWRTDFRDIVPRRAPAYSSDAGQWRLDMPFEDVVGPGGLLTTVGDMQRWNAALADPSASWAARMTVPGRLGDGTVVPYGLGLELGPVDGRPAISHAGSTAGYRAWLGRFPKDRLSVALLCNAGSINTEELGPQVAAQFLPAPPPPAASPPGAGVPAGIVGTWRNMAGALILALGLLVDDAIIAIEMMVVKMEEGYDRIKASAYAWSHTAAPMLAGTLLTVIGLMPVGFAQSTAGEYAGNIFWVVGFALIASWFVAVIFTPYMGVMLLPHIKPVEGGHAAIYQTPRYQRVRRLIGWAVRRKKLVALATLGAFFVAGAGMPLVKKQFFPTSDRPELLVEVQMPKGTAIANTSDAVRQVEGWLRKQPEARIVTSYIGQGAPRFFMALSPELPDPSFAKIVVRTDKEEERDALKLRLRQAVADGLAPEARVRATQLVFGPPSPFPVAFRINGPDLATVRDIAGRVQQVLEDDPMMRTVNSDWGERAPALHFVLDQDRLRTMGLTSSDVAQQLQFLLTGVTVSQAREDIRTVDVVVRSSGGDRLDPARIGDYTLTGLGGQRISVSQIGRMEVRMEEPILQRRDRVPTITVRGDIADGLQPPDVSNAMMKKLQPIIEGLPSGYRVEMAGSIEEAGKANAALAPIFPIMIVLMMIVIVLQVRSLSAMWIVLLTAPLGLIGVVPTLLVTGQPFGFNAILGLISLAGILMRNTLILMGQIHDNERAGLSPFDAVVEATVQRSRPVILTALAAVLAFVPLISSVFWGSMAVTLIGGTLGGTILTLLFLPALYALWFRIAPPSGDDRSPAPHPEPGIVT